jgi:AraC-like DNA-binding protein
VLDVVFAALDAPAAGPARKHPAVARVLRHLEGAAPDADVSLAALAAVADMSPGRLMHAFTEHVGLPLRPYVRWLRLRRAAAALLGGASTAEAAHASGFADAAHMTRTFRAMFGVTPTELSRRSQSVQSP